MGAGYGHLSVEERGKIERWRLAKISSDEMVRVLGHHRSTVFRELRRNNFQDRDFPKVVDYFAMAAQHQTADRRAVQRKLVRYDRLRASVGERLRSGWTPEQIAGRM